MSYFIDGPAAGVCLMLARAPFLLRIVRSAKGWDALDQLDDEPAADEKITVYLRVSDPTVIFVDMSNPRRGFRAESADYRALPKQPARELIASTGTWRNWCRVDSPSFIRELLGTEAETEKQKVGRLHKDAFPEKAT